MVLDTVNNDVVKVLKKSWNIEMTEPPTTYRRPSIITSIKERQLKNVHVHVNIAISSPFSLQTVTDIFPIIQLNNFFFVRKT